VIDGVAAAVRLLEAGRIAARGHRDAGIGRAAS
jgi:hypothetical protein